MPAPGTPLHLEQSFPVVVRAVLDPRKAASTVLMAYLASVVFERLGGTAHATSFKLDDVQPVWPDPSVELTFPSASVIEKGPVAYGTQNLVPAPLEDTWHRFGRDTVLWKTDELAIEFQVDFWCTDDATREAIAARLPALFNPSEERRGVILAGSCDYFERDVRAVLLDHQRIDTQEAAFQNERRLMCSIRCDIDDVHLRCAVELHPRIVVEVREAASGDEAVVSEVVTASGG